jgi:hypothetical protein
MYYNQRETPRGNDNVNLKPAYKDKKAVQAEKTAEDTEYTLSDEDSKRLFISIGKNRRLFPREIILLITNKTSAVREDIGAIRILDNYSFIQVRDTKADEIIKAINGVRFRGRTLTVNFAKPKTETDTESTTS